MRDVRLWILGVAALTLGHQAVATAQIKMVEIDDKGQLVGPPPVVIPGDQLLFVVQGGDARLRFRFREEIANPIDLTNLEAAAPLTPIADRPGRFSHVTTVPETARMVVYNVVNVRTSIALDPNLQKAVDDAQKDLDNKNKLQEEDKAAIAVLQEEIKQLSGLSVQTAVTEILTRQTRIEKLREKMAKRKVDEIDPAAKVLDDAKKALEQGKKNTSDGQMLRLGGLVVGKTRKVVNYRLITGGPPDRPVALERLADYPVIVQDDDLFAVVTNAARGKRPERFVLAFDATPGTAPDPAPVRPSADAAKMAGAGPSPQYRLDDAVQDVILPFGRRVKPNEILKVTISTALERQSIDKTSVTVTDGTTTTKKETVTELGDVKLLEGAEYPQVHALYHYNIATGVVVSALRDGSFTKFKRQVGAAAADTRYAVDTPEGDVIVKPVLAFSFYWSPRDVQLEWSPSELWPAPTVGFSLTSANEDFFFGFTSEIRRNVQLFYGYHHGKVTVRGPVPVDDELVDTAPATRKAFDGAFFAGVTFNINFVKTLFGK